MLALLLAVYLIMLEYDLFIYFKEGDRDVIDVISGKRRSFTDDKDFAIPYFITKAL